MQILHKKVNMNCKVAAVAVILSLFSSSVCGIYVQNELKNVTKRENLSPVEWTEPVDGLWSSLLEEFTINNP